MRLGQDDRCELVRMRWGLVPGWGSKPLEDVPATFDARSETIAQDPVFRNAFTQRRCIIPASGFYEWTGEKGSEVPHLFSAADGSPVLAFAGLWDRWRDKATGEEVPSASIIVSGASEWMAPCHDRMPVLLTPDLFDVWLKGQAGSELLRPAAESALRNRVVSERVSRTGWGDDDPTLVEAA